MSTRRSPACADTTDLQYRRLFEESSIPTFIYDSTTLRIVAVTNSALKSYGYTRKEMLAMSVPDLLPDEDVAPFHAYRKRVLKGEHPGRKHWAGIWRHKHKDGSIVEIDVTGNDVLFDGRECRVAYCPDVTQRNAAARELAVMREELADSERRYRLLFERSPQPMLLSDRRTLEIVTFNQAAVATLGYSREEAATMSLPDLVLPEDADRLRSDLAASPDGLFSPKPKASERNPTRVKRKDGRVIEVEISGDNIELGERHCRISVVVDVTDRNRVAAELEAAHDRAIEASNVKSAFLANMSHELRTPMNGVIGMNDLLLETALSAEQRSYADQVARSGGQMLAIVNDILDISKLEAGHVELEVITYELAEAIDHACTGPRADATAKGVAFEIAIAPDVPRFVRGDGRRLQQVVANLASNAVKFTDTGSVSVGVEGSTLSGRRLDLRITVSDTGIGIDSASLERMFEPFSQADVSTTRLYGGTGLGLAIVRELTELMGGSVTAASKQGRGSTFTVELVVDCPTAVGEEALRLATGDGAQHSWSVPPLVLVVEDSTVNQIVAARTLERCGCRAVVADDGTQGLAAVKRQAFDAVLMDCQMPVLDGYAATLELRRREVGSGRHTPVIAMTAHVMEGDRERCLDAGMDDYIAKPLRRDELTAVLKRWIAQSVPPKGKPKPKPRPRAEAKVDSATPRPVTRRARGPATTGR